MAVKNTVRVPDPYDARTFQNIISDLLKQIGATEAAARANLASNVRVVKAADQTTADYTAGVLVTWDTEHIDTDAWHSTVSNTSRLTVPAGVRVAEFSGAIAVDLSTANTWKNLYLYKNGSLYQVFWWNFKPTDVHWVGHFNSGPLAVTPGDYFELFFQEESDASVTLKSAWSFFSAKALR